ncbi:MAG: purine-binding chemotaxis protein CheW [Clostridia bacterium]|jgi:purine-binding chemotaxis protein CheW|nr:purine-binding chemotaxis protein CheW [Clostridia bacterium]
MKEIQVVAFNLAKEEYAIDILAVQEIIRPTAITRVPKAPSYIEGVINLRGNVVPVVNLRHRFGLKEEEQTETSRVIILIINDMKIGITVDNVTEVIRIKEEDIEVPDLSDSLDQRFVQGVGKYNGRLLLLLDLEEILELTT